MTSVADILVRVNALNAKYGHYASEDAGAARRAKGDDPFEHTYRQLLGEVEALEVRAEEAKSETSRAALATVNAEIRRAKQSLRAEWPKLEKYALKKRKGSTQEDIDDKVMRAHALEERLEAVSDGANALKARLGGAGGGLGGGGIGSGGGRVNLGGGALSAEEIEAHPEYAQTSDESRAFRQEWEKAKARQDEHIETISKVRIARTNKGVARAHAAHAARRSAGTVRRHASLLRAVCVCVEARPFRVAPPRSSTLGHTSLTTHRGLNLSLRSFALCAWRWRSGRVSPR